MTIDPTNPTDRSPLSIEGDLANAGHDAPFTVLPGAVLRCDTCGEQSPADAQCADDAARTEGASDPADMTMVLAVTCPHCGARGSLTLAYGPDADPVASDFLLAVPRNPRAT